MIGYGDWIRIRQEACDLFNIKYPERIIIEITRKNWKKITKIWISVENYISELCASKFLKIYIRHPRRLQIVQELF